MVKKQAKPKELTNLQKRRKLERSRKDERVRKIKKYRPLCVSKGFIEYAYHKEWNDETVDAAALVMHRWFMLSQEFKDRDWMPMPYQMFESMFGTDYVRIKNNLVKSGFLEHDKRRWYKAGSHCSNYRICTELRHDRINASYRLITEELQKRFIENKERWRKLSVAKRKALTVTIVEKAFNAKDRLSYYDLVVQECLTEEQLATIRRLVTNAHALTLNIDEAAITEIARKRFDTKSKWKFDAYVQYYLEMAERTLEPTIRIDRWSRFYGPMTGIAREFWNYVFLNQEQLSGVDVKSSHCCCLLALLKDIDTNYFGNEGRHAERLLHCQFSRQIMMIPGLVEHLRRASEIYAARDL